MNSAKNYAVWDIKGFLKDGGETLLLHNADRKVCFCCFQHPLHSPLFSIVSLNKNYSYKTVTVQSYSTKAKYFLKKSLKTVYVKRLLEPLYSLVPLPKGWL